MNESAPFAGCFCVCHADVVVWGISFYIAILGKNFSPSLYIRRFGISCAASECCYAIMLLPSVYQESV